MEKKANIVRILYIKINSFMYLRKIENFLSVIIYNMFLDGVKHNF